MIGSEFTNTVVTQYDNAGKWFETRMKARPDSGNIGRGSQITADVESDSLRRDVLRKSKLYQLTR